MLRPGSLSRSTLMLWAAALATRAVFVAGCGSEQRADVNRDPIISGHTVTAASCESADVQQAIDSARVGDTVIVPEGDCVWAAGISYRRGIHLAAVGNGQLTLISHVDGYYMTQVPADTAYEIEALRAGIP